MRKTFVITLLAAIVFVGFVTGCKKPSPPPVSELIAKVWTASKVEANNVTVYNRTPGTTPNAFDYSKFRLDLSKPPAVSYTELDGNTFVGKYSATDQRLVLTELNPQPTGSNGTVEFTINSIDENNLKITRTTASPKTGGSTNVYTLTSP